MTAKTAVNKRVKRLKAELIKINLVSDKIELKQELNNLWFPIFLTNQSFLIFFKNIIKLNQI